MGEWECGGVGEWGSGGVEVWGSGGAGEDEGVGGDEAGGVMVGDAVGIVSLVGAMLGAVGWVFALGNKPSNVTSNHKRG